MKKTFTEKCRILESKGWKRIDSIFFGGITYVTFSNPKTGTALQISAKNQFETLISILP